MVSKLQDIEITQNRDATIEDTITDDDGDPFTPTAAIFRVFRRPGSSVVLEKSLSSGISHSGNSGSPASDSVLTIALAPADTRPLFGDYLFEIEATASSKRSQMTTGRLTVLKSGG